MVKKESKTLNILFLSVLVIFITSILIIVSPTFSQKIVTNIPAITPAPTVAPATIPWKTYQNEKYGFEIKYPSDRKIVEPNDKVLAYVSINQEYPRPNILIFPSNSSYLDNNPYLDSVISKQEKIIVNGLESTHLLVTSEAGLETDYLLFGQNNRYFIISYENYDPLFLNIFSTFKILPNTSTWKTYRNQEFGFEFKLPPQYQATENKGFRDGISAIEVVDTSEKVEDMTGKLINKGVFYIRLASQFISSPDANTPKVIEKIGNNTFETFKAIKYEMYDIYYFEKNGLLFVSEQENLHLTNPNFDQILSSLKFTKI